MTIATTRTNEYTIAQIVTMAYRRAGLLNAYQELDGTLQNLGQQQLQLACDELESRGLTAKATELYTLTITASTSSYDLPTYTLAVVNAAMYIPTGSQFEHQVSQMSQEEWQTLTDKSVTSIPTRYFHRRDVVPNTLELWPVPDSDGELRIQVQRIRADANQGTKTIDFERYWVQAIINQVAGQLAMDNSMESKALTLFGLAEKQIERCLGNAREQASFQMVMGHTTGWSGR